MTAIFSVILKTLGERRSAQIFSSQKTISLSGQIWPVEVMVLAGLYLIKLAIWPPTMEVYNVVSMAGFSLIGSKIH